MAYHDSRINAAGRRRASFNQWGVTVAAPVGGDRKFQSLDAAIAA